MYKIGVCLFFITIIALFIPQPLSSQIDAQNDTILLNLSEKTKKSVVTINAYDDHENLSTGSGFFVNNDGDIITNLHVIRKTIRAEIIKHGLKYSVKNVLGYNDEADLVQLSTSISKDSVYTAQLSNSIPRITEPVMVIGSPRGLEYTVSIGRISALRNIIPFGDVLQIDASISPGSSGSIVVNLKGEVVGVVTFSYEGQNLNFAVPSNRINQLKRIESVDLSSFNRNNELKDSARSLLLIGHSQRKDNIDSAIDYYKNSLELVELPETCFSLGYCYHYKEKYLEAIDFFQKALELDPNYNEVYYWLGVDFLNLNNYPKAIVSLLKAISTKLDSNYLTNAHLLLGVSYIEMERWENALEYLLKYAELSPNDSSVYFNIGLCYYNKGDWKQSKAFFQRSIEKHTGIKYLSYSYQYLGKINYKLQNWEEAIKCFSNSVDYDSNDETLYYLGLSYLALNDVASASHICELLTEKKSELAQKFCLKVK